MAPSALSISWWQDCKSRRRRCAAQRSPAKPFDITEYTAAAAEITRSAAQLESLIGTVDRGSPALAQASERAAATLRGVVDHAYWRGAQLLGVLIAEGLGCRARLSDRRPALAHIGAATTR